MKISDQAIFELGLDLFKEGKITPQREPVTPFVEHTDTGPDLSKIELTNEQIQAMMNGTLVNKLLETKQQPRQPEKKVVKEQTVESNKDIKELILEFTSVVQQAVNLLQEMTSCGMIGTNQAAPKKKKINVKLKKKGTRKISDILMDYQK